MKTINLLRSLTAMTLTLSALGAEALAQQANPNPVELVDGLNHVFGKHDGKRASHAKGFCAQGEFVSDRQARQFVDGALFSEARVPAVLRFSVGGGNPSLSDKSRSVRGLSLRIGGKTDTYDLLLISESAFFAATPASFLSFLEARVADPATQKPDPEKIANATDDVRDSSLMTSLGREPARSKPPEVLIRVIS